MNNLEKHKFLNYVIEGIFERINNLRYLDYDPEERLKNYLSRFGWQCIDNKIIPIEILDSVDLTELDPLAREDLVKASTKFRDGDLSGAISSACAAIDSVTANVYQKKEGLGSVSDSSFQERCNKSLEAVGIFEAIQNQLEEIQWKNSNVNFLKKNLKQSINQAAFVMQTL
ncbi:MAG: hypothetical protein KJ725_02685 [Gammaproteobacteria bacterium]|uniref:hypothetical protein n=1 Tax=Methylotuvimicrobium sp. TaxID=2822413 RepID=UPI001D7CFB5D|nr:hypothetical protein [Gammaproteobacteria bacterium]